jgi:hypothetical protein
MFMESLESRRLLSAVVTVEGTTLTVEGTSGVDALSVVEDNGVVAVTDQNTLELLGSGSGITSIIVNANAGNDNIVYTGNSVGAAIYGGLGDDYIAVADMGSAGSTGHGQNGSDTLVILIGSSSQSTPTTMSGDNQDDILVGSTLGWQVLSGGNAGDTLIVLSAATTTAIGGNGPDLVLVCG